MTEINSRFIGIGSTPPIRTIMKLLAEATDNVSVSLECGTQSILDNMTKLTEEFRAVYKSVTIRSMRDTYDEIMKTGSSEQKKHARIIRRTKNRRIRNKHVNALLRDDSLFNLRMEGDK